MGRKPDFTLSAYRDLVEGLARNYKILPLVEFVNSSTAPIAVLRHDVDRWVEKSLACGELLAEHSVRGTFYFRYPATFDSNIISRTVALGHEVGYHYEVLSKAGGDVTKAIRLFKTELAKFRRLVPISTACMHGAPLSPWDNLDIWKHVNLEAFGLEAEAYRSLDFTTVGYVSDTGRTWKTGPSLRDKANGMQLQFRSTYEFVSALDQGKLPAKLMVTVHPERWVTNWIDWIRCLITQRFKNFGKRFLKAIYPLWQRQVS